MKRRNLLLCCLLAAGCRNSTPNNTAKADTRAPSTETNTPAVTIPATRETVKTEPVAEYRIRTENPLNDWYFSVKLYETPQTFKYLIKLKYEELEGDDTLILPNFGTEPKPAIHKGGDEKYSCIIGFLDKQGLFREYKKVYVKNDQLKITAIKRYTVAQY